MAAVNLKSTSRHLIVDYMQMIHPDVVCEDIADKEKFTGYIGALRGVLANGCQRLLNDSHSHPVLTSQSQRWIHVKLQVGRGKKSATTTLAIRDDMCCAFCCDFREISDMLLPEKKKNKAIP